MNILYVTTVSSTMNAFFKAHIEMLVREGHKVNLACNDTDWPIDDYYKTLGCRYYHVDFSRSPLSKDNLKAFGQLKKVIENGCYDIVHCHTPNASVITRLVCRKLRKKTGLKVFYTAHGFHFYKGAPKKNWLIYYPIEKFCSHFTDILITINHEDYECAKEKMKAKQVEYVPSVGVDVDKFANTVVDRAAKRRELDIPEEAFLLLSVGELNENKNHQIVIRALAELKNPNVHYMLAGQGDLHNYLLGLAQKLNVADRVHFLGFRNDIAELYKTVDVGVFPSIREGLGLAAVESMAAGLPLICLDNRGTREYAKNGKNAIVCANSSSEYASAIRTMCQNEKMRVEYGNNGSMAARSFDVAAINDLMFKIYQLEI